MAVGLIVPVSAVGQTSSVVGTVIDQTTLAPLAGARIIANGTLAATSDENGNFMLNEVAEGRVNLRVETDQYTTAVDEIEVEPGEIGFVQIHMIPVTTLLREVLVRAGREPNEHVARVEGDSRENAASAAELLAQQVPGLYSGRTGNLGTGGSVIIRGISSFSGGNNPLVYLDGVRISTADRASGDGMTMLSILEDIPATQIRQIRVLRGPSASARFGESANGVILIETLRGPSN